LIVGAVNVHGRSDKENLMFQMFRGYGNVPDEHFLRTCHTLEEAKGLVSIYEEQDFLVIIRDEEGKLEYQTPVTEPKRIDRVEMEPELPELIIDNDIPSAKKVFDHFCNGCGTPLTEDGEDEGGCEHECLATETEGVEFTT
jgi:hypothetical protein